jgi:hypothetical protein
MVAAAAARLDNKFGRRRNRELAVKKEKRFMARKRSSPAASVAASLASILTGYAVGVQGAKRAGGVASVASALASFSKSMASIAASPHSELERMTATAASAMASILASFAKSLKK